MWEQRLLWKLGIYPKAKPPKKGELIKLEISSREVEKAKEAFKPFKTLMDEVNRLPVHQRLNLQVTVYAGKTEINNRGVGKPNLHKQRC